MTQPHTPFPAGPFQLALTDPAWAFRTYSGQNRTPTQKRFRPASGSAAIGGQNASGSAAIGGQNASGSAAIGGQPPEDHYKTMPLEEMKALPVADMMARDSLLAMWAVGSHLDAALELGEAWGFHFVTDLFYWLKQKLVRADQVDLFTGDIPPPSFSMGYHTRKQLEPCLLFKRGKGLPVRDHGVPQLIITPRAEHSRKPAEQYDRLHRLYGTVTRIELFARNTRPGWTSWGNEVGKYDPPEPRLYYPKRSPNDGKTTRQPL